MPDTEAVKCLVSLAVEQLDQSIETIAAVQREMLALASQLPEYPIVMSMFGVGPVLGPQLMAEIGDVRRFERKQSLVAFAGVDAPPYSQAPLSLKRGIFPNEALPDCEKRYFSSGHDHANPTRPGR